MAQSTASVHLHIFETEEKAFSRHESQLSQAGYIVETYGDNPFPEGWEDVFPNGNHIVLVDVDQGAHNSQLPSQLEHLKKHGATIVVAGKDGNFDCRLNAARLGAAEYLAKPVGFDSLMRVLKTFSSAEQVSDYRVLLVDDDEIHGEYISLILSEAGIETRYESMPRNTLQALEAFDPELVLLDLYMPDCNGLELARIIRQNEKYAYIPIVFLSSETDIDIQLDAMSVGGDDFISKPVDPNYLIKSVHARAKRARYQAGVSDRLQKTFRELEAQKFSLDQHSIVSITDRDGRITYVNEKFLEVSHYTESELLGEDHRILNSGYHPKSFFADLWDTLLAGKVWRGEVRNRTKQGDLYWVNTTIVPFLDEAGEPYQFVSIRTDVSHIKEAESEFSAILNNMQDTFFRTSLEGVVQKVSPSIITLVGMQPEEVIGRSISDLFYKRIDNENFLKRLEDEGGKIRNIELELRTQEGRVVIVSGNVQFYYTAEGEVAGMEGTMRDISVLKESEARVNRLAVAVEQSTDSIVIIGTDAKIEYVNPTFEKLSGLSSNEVLATDYRELMRSSSLDFDRQVWPKITEGKLWKGRVVNYHQGHGQHEEDMLITPIYDDHQRVANFICVGRDITRESIIEERLRKAEKMQAIGTLAGGIAHDFNNILASISGYTEMTKDDLPENSLGRDNLDQVLKASERAKELVEQILAFSRQGDTEVKAFQPALVVKEVVKLLSATLPSSTKIALQAISTDSWVEMDPTQFHQVVMNLCVNASHALKEGQGVIKLSLDNVQISASQANESHVVPGDYVRLLVEDNGTGMPPELVSRIFDPFFTTKEVGEGTGMGLAVVDGIISGAGGTINVESKLGEGTSFAVLIPLASARGEVTGEPESKIDGGHLGQGRILFVDDEELLVNMARQMLSRMGYEVDGFVDSQEALARFKQNPDAYDLVITDQTMPNMTGEMLAREILATKEEIPVIMCTGYSEGFSAEQALELGIRAYLMKPLRRNDLAEAIKRELDNH